MHAVVRTYSGAGVQELFDRIEEQREKVEGLIRGVPGFVSYSIVRSGDSASSITVCQDKAGTDASKGVAREWIQANAADLSVDPPAITEGRVTVHFA